ncbi:MAG: RibD family protein, partial [Desulfopila sp.]
YITSGLPLVALKAGISLDGRLNYQKNRSGSMTGAASLERVHQLRDYYDAILVGRATAEIDNPSLTTRLGGCDGAGGRDPVRIILDGNLALKETARVFHLQSEAVTWVFCRHSVDPVKADSLRALGVKVTPVACDEDGAINLEIVLQELARQDIISVLVEGGGRVHSSFLRQRLADRVHLFYAPIFAGSGGQGVVSHLAVADRDSAIRLVNTSWTRCGEDMLVEGEIRYPCVD